MSETSKLSISLLEAAQSQKHITVNEALIRLDAACSLSVDDWNVILPPSSATEGQAFIIGTLPSGEWTGRDNQVAIWSNGGWIYLVPKAGWSAWNTMSGFELKFDGVVWQANATTISESGATTLGRVVNLDHSISAGATSATIPVIPHHAMVLGVTARVTTDITGSGLTSWSLGVAADATRYATGLGLMQNAFANGISGTPITYWTDTSLVLTPDAGTFSSGEVRISVHLLELVPPRSV